MRLHPEISWLHQGAVKPNQRYRSITHHSLHQKSDIHNALKTTKNVPAAALSPAMYDPTHQNAVRCFCSYYHTALTRRPRLSVSRAISLLVMVSHEPIHSSDTAASSSSTTDSCVGCSWTGVSCVHSWPLFPCTVSLTSAIDFALDLQGASRKRQPLHARNESEPKGRWHYCEKYGVLGVKAEITHNSRQGTSSLGKSLRRLGQYYPAEEEIHNSRCPSA